MKSLIPLIFIGLISTSVYSSEVTLERTYVNNERAYTIQGNEQIQKAYKEVTREVLNCDADSFAGRRVTFLKNKFGNNIGFTYFDSTLSLHLLNTTPSREDLIDSQTGDYVSPEQLDDLYKQRYEVIGNASRDCSVYTEFDIIKKD